MSRYCFAHIVATALVGAAISVSSPGCGGGSSEAYPVSITAAAAPGYFSPLNTCAGKLGLSSREGVNAVFVTIDGTTRLTFMAQSDRFNVIVFVDDSVPEAQRGEHMSKGRARADEIVACALELGPVERPVVASTAEATSTTPDDEPEQQPTSRPTASAPKSSASASAKPTSKPSASTAAPAPTHMKLDPLAPAVCKKSAKRCNEQLDCLITEYCAKGGCYELGADGCPCENDNQCGYYGHCGGGICYPDKAGAPCDGDGPGECGIGTNVHCAKGLCYPDQTGAPCTGGSDCGLKSSCVDGVCN